MLALLQSIARNRRLLKDLVSRDLRARYVGSSMGFFWSIVVPIMSLFVYLFVFNKVLGTRWSDQQGTIEVAVLMLAGIMVWHAFAESISRMTNSLVENQNLIQKVVFPSEVLPAYLTASALVNMMIGLVVALGGVVFFAYVRPTGEGGPPIALWSIHEGEPPARENGVLRARQYRCASEPAQTEFEGLTVIDRAAAPWSASPQGIDQLGPGNLQRIAKGDLVYASGERWGVVRLREGARLTVDGWHRGSREAADAPPNGSQAVVVAPPGRPLALSGWLVLVLPLIVLQGVFMLGLGYLLSAFNLILRDTYHVMGVLLTVWMFATPIFYPAHMVANAGYGWVLVANPMYWLIDSYREILIYGSPPNWRDLGCFALAALVVLFLGARFFQAQKPRFPDLL